MNKLFSIVLFVGFSVHSGADVIDALPKNQGSMLAIIDPSIEEAEERAKTDYGFATWFYFLGGDEYWYTGSIYVDNDTLVLKYLPPGQEGFFENGSCIMAYSISSDRIELILKRWTVHYDDDDSDKKEKEIVYYNVTLTENKGKIEYTCAYTTPALDLHNYTINAATVIDDDVYTYSSPSFHAPKITQLKKDAAVKVLPTKLAENGPEEEPYDFWYKIEINRKEEWVYGYSINFSNKIKIK